MRDGIDQAGRLSVCRRRDMEVRERVPGVRVGAVLRDDQIRPERGRERRKVRLHDRVPRRFARVGRKRHVHDRTGGGGLSDLVDVAGTREQVSTTLVDREREDARVVPEQGLHPIAVMHIEVDVHHPQAIATGAGDRQRGIVVDAEPGGTRAHRVVQTAARMERVLDLRVEDRLHRPHRSTRHSRRRLLHVGERGVVAPADPGLHGSERVDREAANDLDVLLDVAQPQIGIRRRIRGKTRLGADGAKQLDARPEPTRRQDVVGPEVVVGRTGAEDQEHSGTIPTLARVTIRRWIYGSCSSSSWWP
jgi:hypothetical protein